MIVKGQQNRIELVTIPATEEQYNIPVWLTVAGGVLLLVPFVYFIYDKYCKDEGGGPLIKKAANVLVVTYLLIGLVLAVVGFVWVFGRCGLLS